MAKWRHGALAAQRVKSEVINERREERHRKWRNEKRKIGIENRNISENQWRKIMARSRSGGGFNATRCASRARAARIAAVRWHQARAAIARALLCAAYRGEN